MKPKILKVAEEIRFLLFKDSVREALNKLTFPLKNHPKLDLVILHSARYEEVMQEKRLEKFSKKWGLGKKIAVERPY